MPEPALVLVDDGQARTWEPFALTRPVGELRFGAWTLRERAERVFGIVCRGHLTSPHLATFREPWASPVLDAGEPSPASPVLLWSSRAVADPAGAPAPPVLSEREPRLLSVSGAPAGLWLPEGTAGLPRETLEDPAAWSDLGNRALDLPGIQLERVWDLVLGNAERLTRDIDLLPIGRRAIDRAGADVSRPGVVVLGDAAVVVEDEADLEPGVVLDATAGPIWIQAGATVRALTRLAGPLHLASGSTVLGGSLEAVSVGPACKVRGEIEETVFLGYANKAHDGFLGHAYVGAWVNLGALTTNSDLKNNYGSVRMWTPEGTVDTGSIKVGCFLGDHVKTAIGTLLNTGTVVGAGSNLFGPGFPPKYVPPFSWGFGERAGVQELDRFLDTAAAVMARRGIELDENQRRLLEAAWIRARGDGAPK